MAEAGTAIIYDRRFITPDWMVPERRAAHVAILRKRRIRKGAATDQSLRKTAQPALTDWNLIPKRLAEHADPSMRLFFSHWNTAQCGGLRGVTILFSGQKCLGAETQ